MKISRVNVLGVGVSSLNLDSAAAEILEASASGRRGYVCVTGVHGVMEAQQDEEFRAILNGAFLNTPDGMPMVWLGKLHGHREMGRVYGPDLMLEVMGRTQHSRCRHFFYGGQVGVAEELAARLQSRFPGIDVCGMYTPPFRPLDATEQEALKRRFADVRPDITWVGLSTPKQEKFMAEYLPQLQTTLMIGVGAAFDFHAGRVRQAPRCIQRSGFEWLFRLGQEPRRLWRRYLRNNPLFVLHTLCQLTGLKKYPMS